MSRCFVYINMIFSAMERKKFLLRHVLSLDVKDQVISTVIYKCGLDPLSF